MSDLKHAAAPHPLFLAGDPALDFLNTRMRANGQLVDFLQSDHDVLRWLRQAGFPVVSKVPSDFEPLSLLDSARTLRENIRSLLEKQKAGQRGNTAVLNGFLASSETHLRLLWSKPRLLNIERVRRQDSPVAILGAVAEAAADLLATADFRFVKRCEDDTCVLWFSDQTKSHRRRWCSMGICGNRHKVAAYRQRHRREDA